MFDTALLESRRGWKGRGKGVSLPLAIGLHLAVVSAFVGAAVWNTGEPPEPVIPVTFFAPAAAPPPPRGDGGHPHPEVRPPSGAHRTDVAPIVLLPDPAPDQSVETVENGPSDPAEELGGKPGEPDGMRGGTHGGTGNGPGEGAGLDPGTEPVHVGGDVRAPVLVSRVEPEYPEAMRRARMEGVVILEAVITASGEVDQVRVLKSAGPLLDRETVAAVRQ
jgi:protein TonB